MVTSRSKMYSEDQTKESEGGSSPQEKDTCQALRKELEDERRRALRMEARVEEQLAEFDTEREQLRSRLKKEEAHCCRLQQQVGTSPGSDPPPPPSEEQNIRIHTSDL